MSLIELPTSTNPVAATSPAAGTASAPESSATRAVRHRELAAFLRSRRERLTPAEVGLPAAGRRRTPGLRREEVAALAGVGVTWYTWLEQGRDIQPSAQVLGALARTLRLDDQEHRHLFVLAGLPPVAPDAERPCVPASVRAMLDAVRPFPAAVVTARYDLLAYNRSYRFLVEDLDAIPAEQRNSLWLLFTHPSWRRAQLEHNELLCVVARFRAAMAQHLGDPHWQEFLDDLLAASPEFTRLWSRLEVTVPDKVTKKIQSPRVGRLTVEPVKLLLEGSTQRYLMTYVPQDAATRARMEELDRLCDRLAAGVA